MMRYVYLLIAGLVLLGGVVRADVEIPPALQEWQGWVLDKHEDYHCPILFNDATRQCVWPAELNIQVDAKGGEFLQSLEVFSDAWVSLPGNKDFWPLAVTNLADKRAIAVRDKDGVPEVFLSPGKYQLQGKWKWTVMPRTLQIPSSTGIVSLSIDGKKITTPFLENQTQLLLNANNREQPLAHQDSLQLRVFRKLTDNVPIKMLTRIELDISGKERELHLGQALLEEFRLTHFNTDLPAKIEKDGSLRIMAKSGSWIIEIESLSNKSLTQIAFKKLDDKKEWPDQEVWVVEQNPALRNIQITGMSSIDPQQTQLPEEWKLLPAYLAELNSTMNIEALEYSAESTKNQLTLARKMWLDFSGDGYTLKDQISGELHQGWRLETQRPFLLQSATADGQAQLVTQLSADANAGVEIRQRRLNFEGVSRVENTRTIPISGWSSVFNEVSTQLILPPGWTLITASGTSYEYGSWIEKWSLWTFFLVLIISVALAKIIHIRIGAIALVTLIIIYHRADSPALIWLNLAAVLALLPFVSGKFKRWLTTYTYLSFITLGLLLLPFCVQQAREFFYPQMEYAGKNMSDEYYYEDSSDYFSLSSYSSNKPMEAADIVASAPAPIEMRYESRGVSLDKLSKPMAKIKQQYDPNQMVQAGPGIPSWSWNTVQLRWNGPVLSEETTRLYLVSPAWNRIGSLLSLLLPLLLAGLLLRHFISITKQHQNKISSTATPAISFIGSLCLALSLLATVNPQTAQANPTIDEKLLQELENRLIAPAKCLPDCASIESVYLKAEANQLTLDMNVHAAEKIAFPLPGQIQQWWPESIWIDGKKASLMQNSQGQLMVFLPRGTHQITLSASLENQNSIDINFVLAVHNFSSQLNGWQTSGNTQGAISSVQLQRNLNDNKVSQNANEQLRPDPIPPFVIVKRQLNFDLEWSLFTEVIRVAPQDGAINLEIPLLTGESPLDGNINLQNFSDDKTKLQIKLDKQQSSVYWNSRLTMSDSVKLTAAENQPWVEVWELVVSPVWHLQTSGIAAIQPIDVNQPQTWQPWPGETLNINLTRPQAVKGNSLVAESLQLNFSPSQRASKVDLNLKLRTNQANQFTFALPENSSLNQITLNGNKLSITPVKGVLHIPLQPGEQQLFIDWQSIAELNTRVITPALNIGVPTANQSININLPQDRWPLLVGGPAIGPSVLLWGMLAVILILAVQLGKRQLTPLSTTQWVLLSLGIATVNLYILALIAIWFITLNWRMQLTQISSTRRFKWMQFALFCLSIFSLLTLLGAIPYSLLATPDMHIKGNGSSAYYLRWYQDMSAGDLAQAWVISLPLWIYKLVMLVWSIWLAVSLIRWLIWSWKALGHGGFWYASADLIRTDSKEKTETT